MPDFAQNNSPPQQQVVPAMDMNKVRSILKNPIGKPRSVVNRRKSLTHVTFSLLSDIASTSNSTNSVAGGSNNSSIQQLIDFSDSSNQAIQSTDSNGNGTAPRRTTIDVTASRVNPQNKKNSLLDICDPFQSKDSTPNITQGEFSDKSNTFLFGSCNLSSNQTSARIGSNISSTKIHRTTSSATNIIMNVINSNVGSSVNANIVPIQHKRSCLIPIRSVPQIANKSSSITPIMGTAEKTTSQSNVGAVSLSDANVVRKSLKVVRVIKVIPHKPIPTTLPIVGANISKVTQKSVPNLMPFICAKTQKPTSIDIQEIDKIHLNGQTHN